MRGWIWIAALQVVALAVLAHRYASDGAHSLPWSSSSSQCGLLEPKEYVITSHNVVLPNGIMPAAIHVRDGQIVKVAEFHGLDSNSNLTQAAALKFGLRNILDYGTLVVSPGLIDTHVHLNEPGREHWEGFVSGTKAAAAGGTTTAILMPLNSLPAIVTGELLQSKIAASQGKLWMDIGFWGGLVPENANNSTVLQGLLDAGALGFKSFMSPAVDFGTVNEEHIKQALPFVKSAGVVHYVHAEKIDDTPYKGPIASHEAYAASRPAYFEEVAIQALVDALAADKTEVQPGYKIHIAHLSSATGVPIIQRAKQQGLPISVETCPQYLTFDSEDVPDGDTRYKCAPPIRKAPNRELLWKHLLEGAIDIVASDHSPAPPEMKLLEHGDFKNSWGGIAGLQYNLPALWTGMQARGIGPDFLAKVFSEGPARMANLAHRKGSIRPGLDADFVVWDPDAKADTSREALLHKHKDTVYENMSLNGQVKATFVRGHQVYNWEGLSPQPCGKTVLREQPRSQQ